MSAETYAILEMIRAVSYALGVLLCLYLCIQSANVGDRALAWMLGALALVYGAWLTSIAVRYMGMGPVESRTLATPAVVLHMASLALMARRRWLDGQ